MKEQDIRFTKLIVFINSLVPLAVTGWDALHKSLGANPLEFITRTSGMLALIFLMLTLAVTPLRKLTKAQWLIRVRRMLGLYSFFYAALHFLTYVWFDKFFNLKTIAQDVARRPFIFVGMLTFFLLIPLAVTSTNKMIKRLGGKRWAKLHRLTYLAAAGGAFHYWLLVKADTTWPRVFICALAVLLGYRLFVRYKNQKVISPSLISRAK
jgi:sulfoxide reductase heme-binding subunit YedZ